VNRRHFLATGLAAGAAAAMRINPTAAQTAAAEKPGMTRFKLKYAPVPGMFRHHAGEDLIDQIKFAADQGFTAWEDLGIGSRPPQLQEKIAQTIDRLGMTMGACLAYADFGVQSFVKNDPAVRDMLLDRMKTAVEVARRIRTDRAVLVLGQYDPQRDWGYQTANAIDHLRACVDVCAPAGLVLVLEPLNPRDHPYLFLTRMAQAYEICRAVNSPYCKILMDLYHQQITEGNLIPNIDAAWREIAHFHVGDNPGRREPTTGEINYRNIFRHLHSKGYTGVLAMEHGKSQDGKAGEQAVIDAYRACDAF